MPTVEITSEMRERCYNFAVNIIEGDNQHDRLPATIKTRIERTFVGKLAEYAFLHYLRGRGINYPEGDMFTIHEGPENADDYDFKTNNGRTVDTKSASKPFHTIL
ncbi:hypothetical protein MWH25_01070 [Natroniella acetigena]|uniref:hypothetical protein n=1 Tax=Natroniella acetigena TaxID=52004 RepID=UPI00200B0BB0|nr:hypothetical protein [Natroniella acetigena]MCK8826338.1 hypothetical protein [Natroniella acetigena]